MKKHAPAALRNRDPIAAVLHEELPESGTVLEIASGSGEHIVHFAHLFGNLDWRSVGTVGNPSIYTFENDTGPDDANHNINGMFLTAYPGSTSARKEISIFDFAPSVLTQLGLPIPTDMIGKPIT